METIDVRLWEEGKVPYFKKEYNQPEPMIHIYPQEGKDLGCIVICAGGAYVFRAAHEGPGYAEFFHSLGFVTVEVEYRVAPYTYPAMQEDLWRAVKYMRFNAKKYNIDPDKIAICGSSAGGNLVATCMEDYGKKTEGDEIDLTSGRPNAAILCYAVATLGEYAEGVTKEKLTLGDEKLAKRLSAENNVPDDNPPVYIWHTAEDGAVPVENALLVALALHKKNIPFELHVFPEGGHGKGLDKGKEFYGIHKWPYECAEFLEHYGFKKADNTQR